MPEQTELPAGIRVERRSLCAVCKSRISKKIGDEIIWTGHYDTPEGIFCIDCYNQKDPPRTALTA